MLKCWSAIGRSLSAVMSGTWAVVAFVLLLLTGILVLCYGGRAYDRIAATCSGMTPDVKVRSAVHDRDLARLRTLLDEGRTVDTPDEIGATAVQYAVSARDPEALALIAGRSRDIDHMDNSGCTPLFLAVNLGDEQMVRILVQHGASPLAANVHGQTVYEMAQKRAPTRIVRLLEDAAPLADTTPHRTHLASRP